MSPGVRFVRNEGPAPIKSPKPLLTYVELQDPPATPPVQSAARPANSYPLTL